MKKTHSGVLKRMHVQGLFECTIHSAAQQGNDSVLVSLCSGNRLQTSCLAACYHSMVTTTAALSYQAADTSRNDCVNPLAAAETKTAPNANSMNKLR